MTLGCLTVLLGFAVVNVAALPEGVKECLTRVTSSSRNYQMETGMGKGKKALP